ncbi:unnamed protein product [Cylindrotheca closterium]|uniref:Nucleotide-diphospho-sugar transferase domain-containing protein n=1 Tax=Cylindrotheca closterium TaxID=2856 RepID=A0AAD2JGW9_9STRA|nr:unnamed protein product [Cylindrotheca closterium]
MSDRFRSRKPGQNHYNVEGFHLLEELDTHKRRERRACKTNSCSRFSGSLLVSIVALFFGVRLFLMFRNRYPGDVNNSTTINTHETQTKSQKWELPASFSKGSTREQQKVISDVCSERKAVSPLRNESSTSGDVSWTICMTINSGFYDFFRNWYKHYKVLDLQLEIVLFAEDAVVYDRLSNATFLNREYTTVVNATNTTTDPSPMATSTPSKHMTAEAAVLPTQAPSNVTANVSSSSSTDESDENASSGSLDALWSDWNHGVFDIYSYAYRSLIANRPTRLLQVLCSGRNVLYIDTDTVLKKSPLPVINKNYLEGVDISIAIDKMGTEAYAHTYDLCTGFIAIKARSETIDFLSDWEKRCHDDARVQNDQQAFNLAYETLWKNWKESSSRRVTLDVLPSILFPNGEQFFTLYNESQREEAILVHANWIVSGANKKLNLMKHGLWDPE